MKKEKYCITFKIAGTDNYDRLVLMTEEQVKVIKWIQKMWEEIEKNCEYFENIEGIDIMSMEDSSYEDISEEVEEK